MTALITLTNLNLSGNHLNGSIPDSLTNMSLLKTVDLSGNMFTGSLPEGLGNLTNLQSLFINQNDNLGGTIPESVGNLTKLQYLDFSGNQLVGTIPDSLGRMVNLQYFNVERNQLVGTIPDSFTNLHQLYLIYAKGNQLTSLPDSLGGMAGLQYVDFSANQLAGSIPDSVGSLGILAALSLQANHLSGNIPASLTNLINLAYINVSNNCFVVDPGTPNYQILSQIEKLSQTVYLPQSADCPFESIGGIVSDGSTGKPVEGATVDLTIQGNAAIEATTDGGGSNNVNVALFSSNASFAFASNSGGTRYLNGEFQALLTGVPAQGTMVIDASTNLMQWLPILTNPPGGGLFQFLDPGASNFPSRFYRARVRSTP